MHVCHAEALDLKIKAEHVDSAEADVGMPALKDTVGL